MLQKEKTGMCIQENNGMQYTNYFSFPANLNLKCKGSY